MPVKTSYPGVYIEELPSGVHSIVGVSTATTAFVGRALKGPVDTPIVVSSFTQFARVFGGLWPKSTMSFAVQQYFANGGGEAVIVRVFRTGNADIPDQRTVRFTLAGTGGQIDLKASSPGEWAKDLVIDVNHITKTPDPGDMLINIVVHKLNEPPLEVLRNLSLKPDSPSFIGKTLDRMSEYLRLDAAIPGGLTDVSDSTNISPDPLPANLDGADILPTTIVPTTDAVRTGIYALDTADIFNLMCLPPPTFDADMDNTSWQNAANYCAKRRAMLIIDPKVLTRTPDNALADLPTLVTANNKNAAVFYPRILLQNPMNPDVIEEYPPCGAVAGVFARIDTQRGVWKAPAGTEATLAGVQGLTYPMTDDENGRLNPVAINCLRTFPLIGSVVWGARTMDGKDANGSEWKYIPVRRTALFIEESLYRGLKWVVFEPNDEPLWAQIRLNAGAFLHNLFRQGAFQGASPRDAYFVKCDHDTTTQADIDLGIVNVLVGFAPLKPAEFVVLKIQQIAGQLQA
ncbi:MAG: phage tail sheath subtilisin-like domain-containing protein [Acidobacteriota bacterium]|nr:phage tail sheath subtilisin-like domain-containing protein [Acidobacteriota bacterium]